MGQASTTRTVAQYGRTGILTSSNNKESKSTPKLKYLFFKIGLTAIILYFVFRELANNWNQVVSYNWSLDFVAILISIVIHLLTFLFFSRVWCWLMESYDHSISLKSAFKIGYLSNLGRYIPGKFWPVFGMAYLAKQIGVNERESVSSWIVALLYANLSSAVLCIIIFIIEPSIQIQIFAILPPAVVTGLSALVLACSLLLLILPRYVGTTVNFVMRFLKREPVEINITRKNSARVFFGYLICWTTYGLAFWVFLGGLGGELTVPPLVGIGTFVVAYQIGYLAIFAPAGIGVRELAISLILQPYIGPAALGVAVAARLWNMIAEILAAILALRITLGKKSNSITESAQKENSSKSCD
ncbi:flippase-like domain-containing protein [Gemmatimonas aurantiaca]|nr:flippase-like domain-containing protein [Gemmatimonas aurantiaca]